MKYTTYFNVNADALYNMKYNPYRCLCGNIQWFLYIFRIYILMEMYGPNYFSLRGIVTVVVKHTSESELSGKIPWCFRAFLFPLHTSLAEGFTELPRVTSWIFWKSDFKTTKYKSDGIWCGGNIVFFPYPDSESFEEPVRIAEEPYRRQAKVKDFN